MKTRMVSARCCCGAVGPIPCDPVTGITDDFQTLQESTGDGGWGYSVGLAVTPVISPVGTLVIDQNDPFFGVPWTFFRCSVWTPNFTNIRHYLKSQFENFGTEVNEIRGVSVYATFMLNGVTRTWALSHDVAYVTGTGWRHRFTLEHPNAANAVWFSGPIIQAAQSPAPTGPFDSEIQFVMFKLLSGAWQVTAYNGNTVLGSRATATPTNSGTLGGDEAEWSHGFSGWSDLKVTRVDRWQYFAST